MEKSDNKKELYKYITLKQISYLFMFGLSVRPTK